MKYSQSGVRLLAESKLPSKRIKHLLHGWTEECHRQFNAFDEEAPWWYGERANISVLASAAARLSWIALEEFATQKTLGSKSKDKKKAESKYGRCDLYVYDYKQRGSGNVGASGQDFAFEAKHAWGAFRPKSGQESRVEAKWSQAVEAARCLHIEEADHKLGLLFFVPFAKNPEFSPEERMSAVERACSFEGVEAVAWYWIGSKIQKPPCIEANKEYYPGIVVALRSV